MVPEEVCHYTKRKTVFKILSTKRLQIGQFKFTNDPWESKERNFPLVKRFDSQIIDDSKYSFDTSIISETSNIIASEEWKVLCVTLHLPQKKLSDSSKSSLKNHFTQIFNERLRQGYSHPRMWAQYADNHTGACLIFDGNKLNNKIHNIFRDGYTIRQGPVKYENNQLLPWGQFFSDSDDFEEMLREFYIRNYDAIFCASILIGSMRLNIVGFCIAQRGQMNMFQ